MIAEPFDAAAFHVTVALAFPPVTVPIIGAPGTPCRIELDSAEGSPVPIAFVAVTTNVYGVPLIKPYTIALVAYEDVFAVNPSGIEVTVYPVIGELFDAGAVHLTVAL